MKKIFILAMVLAFAVFIFSCGGGEDAAKKSAETKAEKPAAMTGAGAYKAMSVTNGGVVSGTVTFAGEIPAKQKLEVTKDVVVCGKEPHYKEDLLVSSNNKGMANVIVSIKNIDSGKALSALGETFELDQKGCTFKPHVVLVPAGAELIIKNSDGILHNVHTYSELNTPVNLAQPGFKKKMIQKFEKAEIIRVACDVHNWMGAYIAVVDHPYHVITSADGKFELTDVPAGTYTLEFWQETLGTRTMEVTVTEGGTVEANMEFTTGS